MRPIQDESVGDNNSSINDHTIQVLYHSICFQTPYVLAESDGAIPVPSYETRHSVITAKVVSNCRLLSETARANRRIARDAEKLVALYLHQPVEMDIKRLERRPPLAALYLNANTRGHSNRKDFE